MSKQKDLSMFEKNVIKFILNSDAPEYMPHMPYLMVSNRENTGVGCYIDLYYSDNDLTFYSEKKTLGQTVYAEIENLKGGAGFILYIDNGRITVLECFSHTSACWPDSVINFSIQKLK